jgi:nitrogen fixation/metabolism regulation signal transduction histidine kinase
VTTYCIVYTMTSQVQQELDLSHTLKPNVTDQHDYLEQQTDSINKNNQPTVTNVVKQFSLFNEMPQPLLSCHCELRKRLRVAIAKEFCESR